MKKYLLMGVMAIALAVPCAAMAETTPPAPPAGAPVAEPAALSAPNFEAHKAEVLKHFAERIEALQKAQTCAQGAADAKALHACMPERPMGGMMRKGMMQPGAPAAPAAPAAQPAAK